MIKGNFRLGNDVVEVIIKGNDLMFADTSGMITTVEGLKLSKAGVIKEFPDLENDKEWKKKAIERLKEHMRKLDAEMKKINYVKEELIKHGYELLFLQRAGFRPQKF